MRKLALMFGALGLIAFTGLANAEDKTENSVKTESGTTITGKHKNTKTKKMTAADGTTTESKTEVVTPKADNRDMDKRDIDNRDMDKRDIDKRDIDKRDMDKRDMDKREVERRDIDRRDNGVKPVRDDDRNKSRTSEVSEKTEEHTTLTGKHQTKSTKKVERPDGTQIESTTTTTEPKR